ncbi:MAG: complex I NDUFA9 subunit family protein [Pseudomonadota bacterium]
MTALGKVVVFGGTGFLGRAITSRLVAGGIETFVAARQPAQAWNSDRNNSAGLVRPVEADIRDEQQIRQAIESCDGVVNAVGLYVEKRSETFEAIHVSGAQRLASLVAELGIGRLVHISGIGADEASRSDYVRARAKGDVAVKQACPWATIMRPSALFGPNDGLLTGLAGLVRRLPIVPLFGRGQTRLQPVHVDDVAAGVAAALNAPDAPGRIYELGGHGTYRYAELLQLISAWVAKRRMYVPVPFPVWDFLAMAGSVLPNPPLTPAQMALMRADNVVGHNAPSLVDLGVEPSSLETFLQSHPPPN